MTDPHILQPLIDHTVAGYLYILNPSTQTAYRIKAAFRSYAFQRLQGLAQQPGTNTAPVCGEVDSVVADLESSGLERGVVIPFRLVCADCELVVAPQHLFLAEELLRDQATEKRAAILKGYGFEA